MSIIVTASWNENEAKSKDSPLATRNHVCLQTIVSEALVPSELPSAHVITWSVLVKCFSDMHTVQFLTTQMLSCNVLVSGML